MITIQISSQAEPDRPKLDLCGMPLARTNNHIRNPNITIPQQARDLSIRLPGLVAQLPNLPDCRKPTPSFRKRTMCKNFIMRSMAERVLSEQGWRSGQPEDFCRSLLGECRLLGFDRGAPIYCLGDSPGGMFVGARA
jgi:hypothetical protein